MLTHGSGGELLANALRAGAAFIRNGQIDRRAMYQAWVQNNTLPTDATRSIDSIIEGVGRRALRAVADVSGLTTRLDRGVGSTSYEYHRITPVGEATQGMSILDLGGRDLTTYTLTAIPVPVTASQFRMDARHIAAGRGGGGESVDQTNIAEHTRSVFEKLEDTLVNGSDVVLGGNTLPGYTNFGSRNTVTMSGGTWSSATNTAIVVDVLAAIQALEDDGFGGPYKLYIPSGYASVMGEDYTSGYAKSVRARLLEIEGVSSITVLPTLPAANVLLVQVDSSVVRMPIGQDFVVLPNSLMAGLATEWYLLIVATFALLARNVRAPLSQGTLPALTTGSGIAHLTA
jgi:uncharacterized linocin/CFP29 family protein